MVNLHFCQINIHTLQDVLNIKRFLVGLFINLTNVILTIILFIQYYNEKYSFQEITKSHVYFFLKVLKLL